jgi:membrane protein DedA with SNARE-associated domain
MTAPVATIGEWVRQLVTAGGYPALGVLVFLENLFPPIPSEVILPLAGFYVNSGELTFIGAVLAATAGSVAGALVIYGLARFGGRALLLRHGRWLRIRESDLDRADDWFDRHGAIVVLVGRLVPGARSLVSIPAGLSEMPLGRFVALTALGSTLWNAALVGAGWGLGRSYEKVGGIVGPVGTGVTVAIIAAVLVVWWRRRRKPAEG